MLTIQSNNTIFIYRKSWYTENLWYVIGNFGISGKLKNSHRDNRYNYYTPVQDKHQTAELDPRSDNAKNGIVKPKFSKKRVKYNSKTKAKSINLFYKILQKSCFKANIVPRAFAMIAHTSQSFKGGFLFGTERD